MVIKEGHTEILWTGLEYLYNIYNIQMAFNCEYYYSNIKADFNCEAVNWFWIQTQNLSTAETYSLRCKIVNIILNGGFSPISVQSGHHFVCPKAC